jgi:hypothetical protein
MWKVQILSSTSSISPGNKTDLNKPNVIFYEYRNFMRLLNTVLSNLQLYFISLQGFQENWKFSFHFCIIHNSFSANENALWGSKYLFEGLQLSFPFFFLSMRKHSSAFFKQYFIIITFKHTVVKILEQSVHWWQHVSILEYNLRANFVIIIHQLCTQN